MGSIKTEVVFKGGKRQLLISGWTNNHRVFNNQTGGALFWLCTDSFGENCPIKFAEDQSGVVNLTPINSVKLTP